MTDLLLTILIMSLVCCGAHVVINDDWLEGLEYKKQIWMKPLWACCRCMASVWGGVTYILVNHQISLTFIPLPFRVAYISIEWNVDRLIIPAILATAFLNSVFINYYYSKT